MKKDIKVFLAPKRFEPNETTKEKMGFSDHFAVITKLTYPKKEVVAPKKEEVKKEKAYKKGKKK